MRYELGRPTYEDLLEEVAHRRRPGGGYNVDRACPRHCVFLLCVVCFKGAGPVHHPAGRCHVSSVVHWS